MLHGPLATAGRGKAQRAISRRRRPQSIVLPLTSHQRAPKAIDRHQRGIQAHLKSMLNFDEGDDTDDDGDDEPLIEGEDEADGDDDKAFLVELRKLAEQAEALTTT
jgi:hypothetical protein